VIVCRARGSWRANRGSPEVRINGQVRDRLAAGATAEFSLSAGTYRIQVGREVVGFGQLRFYGSPPVTVQVPAEGEVRIRVDPSGVPDLKQMQVSESMYRLTVDGPGGTTVTELPAELDTVAGGMWVLSPITRGLLERPNPARSWQAVISIFLVLYTVYVVIAITLADHVRTLTWIWSGFVVGGSLLTISAWISLIMSRAKIRHSHSSGM
jgi:hypothetical protein